MTTYKSVTGNRMIIDVVVPGYSKEMLSVNTALKNGGEDFVITVKGKYERPTGSTGKLVPRFAYEKVIDEKFKETFEFQAEGTDFDLEKLKWDVKNGVLRISIPKVEEAVSKPVEAIADGDNINAIEGEGDE